MPDVIVTRRTRTISMSGRIEDEVREGTVKFFCRSRGHGFIDDDEASVSRTNENRFLLVFRRFLDRIPEK